MPSDPALAARPRDRRPFAPVVYVDVYAAQAQCTACSWKSEVRNTKYGDDKGLDEIGRNHVREVHGVEPPA